VSQISYDARDCNRAIYVPTELSDTLSANMRKTIEDRAAVCKQTGNQPVGYIPAIFGSPAYGTPS